MSLPVIYIIPLPRMELGMKFVLSKNGPYDFLCVTREKRSFVQNTDALIIFAKM